MADEAAAPRSRRALLTAAAGAAGALAASAALPLVATAHDADDVQLGGPNAATTTTSITNNALAGTAFAGAATGDVSGTDVGYGVRGTSLNGAGVFGWSVSAPDPSIIHPTDTKLTGVFGSAPRPATTPASGPASGATAPTSASWELATLAFRDPASRQACMGSAHTVSSARAPARLPASWPWGRRPTISRWRSGARSSSADRGDRPSPPASRASRSRWPGSIPAAGSSRSCIRTGPDAGSSPSSPSPGRSRST